MDRKDTAEPERSQLGRFLESFLRPCWLSFINYFNIMTLL